MLQLATSVRVRLPRLAAALLCVVPLLTGGARAAQVTISLNGKVQAIAHTAFNPNVEQLLAAKGVTNGVPVALKLVLEDTTPPVEVDSPYVYQQYNMAIVDVVLTSGTWEAHFAPPAGLEATNFVQVADDQNYIGFDFDGWSGTALGVDTDNILSVNQVSPNYGTFLLHFTNSPAVPATTGALVQDLKKYKFESTCSFFGGGGTILVDFTPAPAGVGASLARKGQLKAAAKLGSSIFKGLGTLTAGGPDKDPFGTLKDALLQKSSDTFGTQFVAAINKALKKGGSAPMGESDEQGATTYLMSGLQDQFTAITADGDSSNAIDRAMRGAILKALAAECRADFLAHSKDVVLPDSNKLNAKIEKSREKFIGKVNAIMDKALKKGVVFFGPSPDAMANALKPFVDTFVDLTGTGIN